MVEKGKITALQMGIMMYPTIIATAILIVPGITAEKAHLDLWVSPIWASIVGCTTVLVMCALNRIYPEETLIQYINRIIGRIPGKAIALLVLVFYLHVTGVIIKEYAEFISGIFLTRTPLIVIISSLTLVCAFAVRSGIEVVARLSELIVPIIIFIVMILIILLLPDLEIRRMFPMFENGIMPSIEGALAPMGWFSEYALISFMLPFLVNRKQGQKFALMSMFIVAFTLVLVNFVLLFLVGGGVSNILYPFMSAVRYISIADFFEHVESLVMAIWVMGAFLKISVFYYSITLGTAQWLNLSSIRNVVFPIGILLVLFTYWTPPTLPGLSHYLGTQLPYILMGFQTGFPLLLLIITLLRRRGMKKRVVDQ
jgi:spore germination protein KB